MTEQPPPVGDSARKHRSVYTIHSNTDRHCGPVARELRGYADKNGITFPLLIDKTRSVIKSYGVYHWLSLEAYNIARPATFIIDKTGIIRYMYIGTHQFDLAKQTEVLESLKKVAALQK